MSVDWLADPNIWASFLTLTVLEIVLGIDNLIFSSIVAGRLPVHQQDKARKVGLSLALFMRLALLASISWIVSLTNPLFSVWGQSVSWRDIILIGGGLFLIYKGTKEIHELIEGGHDDNEGLTEAPRKKVTFAGVIGQIIVLDIVFSLDSVITAVGMADNLWVMSSAVLVAVLIMLVASGPVANFVNRHPSVKMLALAFLLLIGMVLVADGLGYHVPKGFIYAAMGFSVVVESLNLVARRKRREA
jgi:predicted tellurium resistance membrane protein TerC